MKYHFNFNYCLQSGKINLATVEYDFCDNLSEFLGDCGIKPKAAAWAIAKSAYWRMTCNNMMFHNPTHIMSCIQMYHSMIFDGLMKPLSVIQELALWFHDIAYCKNGITRNSRDLAVAMLQPWMGNTYQLGQLIDSMSTNFYSSKEVIEDSKILLDIDLCYLAVEEKAFQKNLDLMRLEEPEESDEKYNRKMYDLFSILKEKLFIFRTSSMLPYEKFARRNVEIALQRFAHGLAIARLVPKAKAEAIARLGKFVA